MAKVSFIVDDSVPKGLLDIYRESLSDEFVGSGKQNLTDEQILKDLEKFKTTSQGTLPRLGILKIFYLGILVGFSIPRQLIEREYPAFKITDSKKWYRVGTVYISLKYRKLGIMKEVLKLFILKYKNVMWSCNAKNIASEKSALSAGMTFSHYVYLGKEGKWSTEHFRGVVVTTKVFKTS